MGTLNLAAPLVLIDRSRLRGGFHLLPSLHYPTYNTLLLCETIKHTVTLTSLAFITQIQIHITHVTWSTQEVRESKIDYTNATYPRCAELQARNMQQVDIRHKHFFETEHTAPPVI